MRNLDTNYLASIQVSSAGQCNAKINLRLQDRELVMLKGNNIVLRPVQEKDLEYLYSVHTDIANRGDYFPIGVRSEPAFRKDFQENGFWSKEDGLLLIEGPEHEIVGHIEYYKTLQYLDEYELSYQLYSEKYWGKGYTSQAVSLLVAYIFSKLKTNRIRLVIHPDNKGSRKVAEKCGFTYEGIARGAWFHNGANHDVSIYSILRDEVQR
jgi:RimJ/RimL family protein N-acetyltransferase